MNLRMGTISFPVVPFLVRVFPLLVMVGICFAVAADSKTKKTEGVPPIFLTAHYAYVEALDGDVFDLRLLAEDRRAISDVEDALRDWKRYVVTARRDEAELLFVVRKGRIASAQGGGGIGVGNTVPGNQGQGRTNPQTGPEAEASVGAEVGPPDDLLYVYILTPKHERQGPIWKQYLKDGLDKPAIPLFRQLKDAVEAAQKAQKS